MTSNEKLREEAGDVWPDDEPLDFRDSEVVEGYYYPDIQNVANAHADWIARVRLHYPELLHDQTPKPSQKTKEFVLIERINKIKR